LHRAPPRRRKEQKGTCLARALHLHRAPPRRLKEQGASGLPRHRARFVLFGEASTQRSAAIQR